jgi:thioredoxin 1
MEKRMANLMELNESNFDKETAEGITLVDFWAPWCGPCKMLGPVLEKVAEELGDKVLIAKINVDESPKLAQKFGVRSIPAIFILKNGKSVNQFVGLQDKGKLIQAINNEL